MLLQPWVWTLIQWSVVIDSSSFHLYEREEKAEQRRLGMPTLLNSVQPSAKNKRQIRISTQNIKIQVKEKTHLQTEK